MIRFDQTVQMHRLILAFVVRIWNKIQQYCDILRFLHVAEAGYLLLVTSYWLLIRILVTDSTY